MTTAVMVERLRPQKRVHCSYDSCQELYEAMNARPETVVVRRDKTDDVLTCHQQATRQRPDQALPSLRIRGHKYYTVDRLQLMQFMSDHGKVCPHG